MTRATAMLVYKAWAETRSRLAIGAATLGVISVLAHGSAALGDSRKTVFVMLAIVLGTGALRQERALGTLGFSLALPVSRGRQVVARAAVAIAEVWALAWFVALSHADLGLGLTWAVCGSLIACLAQLLASVLASDYLVYLGSLLIVTGYEAVVQLTALRDQPLCDLYRVMSGGPSVAWPALGGAAVLGAGMLGLAAAATRRLAP